MVEWDFSASSKEVGNIYLLNMVVLGCGILFVGEDVVLVRIC